MQKQSLLLKRFVFQTNRKDIHYSFTCKVLTKGLVGAVVHLDVVRSIGPSISVMNSLNFISNNRR